MTCMQLHGRLAGYGYMYVEQRLRWYGETGGGVENTSAKSGSLFALHTDTLSFISID